MTRLTRATFVACLAVLILAAPRVPPILAQDEPGPDLSSGVRVGRPYHSTICGVTRMIRSCFFSLVLVVLNSAPILSDKDRRLPSFSDWRKNPPL